MTCLLITYDLNSPGQDYKVLHDTIKGLGTAWWHHLDSTWLIRSTLTVSQASARIKAAVDDNDSYLVLDITGDSSQGWLPQKAWDWIHTNV